MTGAAGSFALLLRPEPVRLSPRRFTTATGAGL